MKLYNTISRSKEEFIPEECDEVKIYSCGPTVYNYAHIGNLRTYIFMDQLRRVLHRNGYKLRHVMNITDVGHLVDDGDDGEDKMEKAARELRKTPWEIAEEVTGVFFTDISRLNIERPEITPKATDNIDEMIAFVIKIIENGYGYETSDGIYFDIQKLTQYGMLSKINLEDQLAGARVEVNDEKRHPADFALWKKAPKEHIMQWESPWGMGYPGWHIECSALGLKYLGETFDIHTGGVDHIPIHHENEIAQNISVLGQKAAKYWIHGEFMLVDNGKMGKSLGNAYTIDYLIKRGYSPMDFRYFCLNAHYRSKLNFTFEGMDSAKRSLKNLITAVSKLKNADGDVDNSVINMFKAEFDEAVNDDLNIPKALGIVWNMARFEVKSRKIYELILDADRVLALNLQDEPVDEVIEIDSEIELLIAARQLARKEKNFLEADRIRDVLKDSGIILEDTADGVKWRRL